MDRIAAVLRFFGVLSLAIVPALVAGIVYPDHEYPTTVALIAGIWPVLVILGFGVMEAVRQNGVETQENFINHLKQSKSSLEDEVKLLKHHPMCRKRRGKGECNCIDIFHACVNCPGQVPVRQG